MNALLFERPVWFATGPLVLEEVPHEMEDFIYHRPVLAVEAIELLAPHPGSLVVDGTVGGGGHTEAILKTGADVLALDQDPDAIAEAREQLAPYGGRVTLHQANFRDADIVLDRLGIKKIGGALLDLGVSSRQLENAWRGFSMLRNGPLDMRMDPTSTTTAAHIVNNDSEEDLIRIFRDLGEEPAARRLASLIVKMRKDAPFTETLQLTRAIEKVVGRHGRRHPATQVFQALRMEVNDELGALEQGLRVLTARLELGARIAVITFHSLEDRIVKNFIRDHSREWLDRPEWPEPRRNPEFNLRFLTGKPLEPSENERRINPRSRSAKLRVAEKIG
ncbi:MAG TPA: 16S rRNA (cytosine(1402)-N(4))-methyltransferase RsmH [Chthoniobacterales bacterium]|jgi:16S rRNA (cytosine1402-N4)-methyltransferase|nr:16S rRNA (cytosine(1402)-N(4))-methyltransferase RsmH [Chthoniobacterales bacterium]